MQTLVQDLRFGARMLLKKPGFTLIAVIMLALGIGANTAIFSVVNAYLFKPLPVRDPDRLVVLASKDQRSESPHGTSYLNYEDIRNQRDVFTDVIAYTPDIVSLNVDGEAERSMIELVSGNYFAMLGVEATHGRTFAPDEGQTIGSSPVMVLSYGYWERRFGGDVSAIGKTVKVNNQPFTIIGVAPESFPGTEPILTVNAYAPLMMKAQLHQNQQDTFTQRGLESFRVMGRLAPGVSVMQAGAPMETLARNIARQYPDVFKELSFLVVPETKARPWIGASAFIPRMAAILMMLVGLILLIACANVSNLILSRAAMRKKEMAIRSALGASRFRLIRLLLSESVLLGLLSGVAGVVIALWATNLLSSVRMATDNPVRFEARPDWRVFLFLLVAALATGVIAGLVPAFRSSRLNLSSALKEGWRDRASGAGSHRLRNVLVVSQVAASLLLLVCAGLFMRSLQEAQQIDLGFRRDGVLMFSVDTELQSYDRQRGQRFYRQLLDRLNELPQVRSAGLGTHKPLVGWVPTTEVFLPERGESAKEDSVNVLANRVSADYFETLNIPVLEGRAFTVRDDEAAPRVAVINETMARAYWPRQNTIGRQLRLNRGGPPVEIVGVVKNSKYGSIGEEPRPCLYLPFAQNYQSASILFLHTKGDPAAVTAAARQVVSALDQDMPVYDLKTMNTHLSGITLLFVRVGAALVGVFGLLGLLLAVVGLYGVISHSVSQRTHEIGIRIALGAHTGVVLRMVLKQGMILTLVGVAAGLAAAFAVTRLMRSLLYGVSTTDPLTFILISLLLASVALLACYLPARRATKVDPMMALRAE
jgi:putative ABC transport system permease protein